MEEDPQDHDFDQRHDGPLQETSSGQVSTPKKRAQTVDFGRLEKTSSRTSLPNPNRSTSNPFNHPVRHSTQIARGRTSRDFDRRTDGPYGRPSLAMSRRRSSGQGLPSPTTHDDLAVTSADSQAAEDGEAQNGQPPESMETMLSSDPAFEPEPPPLNYTLDTRKRSITIFWSLVLIDSIAMPIGLYFGLWYGTDLSPNTVFSIVTAALGGVSIGEYVMRFWRLWKKGSTCRVIGARRSYLDWFHWNLSAAWFIVMCELIIGTVFKNPPIRLLSMPATSMLYAFGIELLIVDVLRFFKVPSPVRLSSVPKGAQLRPCVYSFIEDVCAVDGGGGTDFREALNRRYEASHIFRAMLRRLGLFWAVGSNAIAVLCTILIFTLGHNEAYVVGWSVPFIWAGVWVLITIWYVKRMLKEERVAWAEELAAKTNA